MPAVRFSRRAESDLLEIAAYSLRRWGETKALRYIDGLESYCEALARNPELGTRCHGIRPEMRRIEHGSHLIFYRRDDADILVLRVLHRRMLPERHAIADDESK